MLHQRLLEEMQQHFATSVKIYQSCISIHVSSGYSQLVQVHTQQDSDKCMQCYLTPMLTCGFSTGGMFSWLFYTFRCFDDGARGDHNTRCHNLSSLEVLVHFGTCAVTVGLHLLRTRTQLNITPV